MKIVAVSGSLRKGSYNTALLRAAAEVAPVGTEIEILSIREIPLYDGDVEERDGIPAAAARVKDAIAGSAGLLLATPEYNHSVPGVLKNALDWWTRPSKDIPRVFRDKPVAIVGATPGQGGTRLAQAAWLPVFRALGTRAWFGKQLYVSGAAQVFDAQGSLVDEKVRKLLTEFVAGFAAFAKGDSR
jgi:NAD(P)H-dependent FMN reductase